MGTRIVTDNPEYIRKKRVETTGGDIEYEYCDCPVCRELTAPIHGVSTGIRREYWPFLEPLFCPFPKGKAEPQTAREVKHDLD